jgi:mono/diheme cytochrome c family protein
MNTRHFFHAALAIALTSSACSKSESPPPPPTKPAAGATNSGGSTQVVAAKVDHAAKAKEIFATRCTPCHGAEGKGDGAASASLTPPPRNFHDPAWQSSVDDAYLEKIIKLGGAAVGKSTAMPSNPDLTDPAVISALKDYVRALGKTP